MEDIKFFKPNYKKNNTIRFLSNENYVFDYHFDKKIKCNNITCPICEYFLKKELKNDRKFL